MLKIEAVYSSLISVKELEEQLQTNQLINLPAQDGGNSVTLSVTFARDEPKFFQGTTADNKEVIVTKGLYSEYAAAHPTVIVASVM